MQFSAKVKKKLDKSINTGVPTIFPVLKKCIPGKDNSSFEYRTAQI